jgi:hypothetical protein
MNRQREEVLTFTHLFGADYGTEYLNAVHGNHDGTCGLTGYLAGFDGDGMFAELK